MKGAVKYLLLLVVSILAASCIFDAERCVISTDKQYGVMFTVSLSGQHTRAAWEEEYPSQAGVPFDYRIVPENLRMVVFTAEGERVGVIDELDYWPINEKHTEFQFMGQLPREVLDHINANSDPDNRKYRFMVLVNCLDNLSGEEYITYSHTQLDPAAAEAAIPMWGVKQVDVSPLYTRGNLDIGDVSLLRAAAKVEVKLSETLKEAGTTINSATLKYYNQTGYVLPGGWSQVSDTKKLDQENCFRIYRHAAVNMPLIKDETTGDYYVYVTEYDNINYAGERNKISLEFTVAGEAKYFEDAISFCNYRDGAPEDDSNYNIVRNHIYEFEILSIAGSSLVLDYTVANWVTEDWGDGAEYEEHELAYPTYHNPVVPYEFLTLAGDKQASYVIKQEPTMYYGGKDNLEAGGFHCYFQITKPQDVQWKPVFMGSKENYQIRVYKVDKNLVQSSVLLFDTEDKDKQGNLSYCKDGEWFHIVVFPKSADGEDNTSIEFGVSYYQKWTDQYINLFVNGEYSNIRWPNSGTNPKIINIRHVSAVASSNEE
ncbi:MAG: hypothetical protein IKV29_03525 [Alistipes sp.]|nr:hypothetical protein [Alistipes sp.]